MYFVHYGNMEAMTVDKMRKRKILPHVNNNTGLMRLGVLLNKNNQRYGLDDVGSV